MNHPIGSQLSDYSSLAMGAVVIFAMAAFGFWNIRREKREIEAKKQQSSTKP
jgi:hypothetical protein